MGDDRRVAGSACSSIALSVSVSVPIWLSLMSIALATPSSMPASAGRRSSRRGHRPRAEACRPSARSARATMPTRPLRARPPRRRWGTCRRARPRIHHLGGVLHAALEVIRAVAPELCRGRVECDRDPPGMPGPIGGGENDVDRLSLEPRSGAKPPSSPTAVASPRSCSRPFSVWKTSAPICNASANEPRPAGTTMNSWRSRVFAGVRAAVDDVHHRHGEHDRLLPAQRAVERQPGVGRRRLRHGQRHAEQGVRAERALVRRAVELDEASVDRCLIARVETLHRRAELGDDVADRPQDALAEVRLRIAVTQLDRLVLPGGRAGRNGGAPNAPDARTTSTSTVGLPRESRICRAATRSMALTRAPPPRAP